MAYKPRIKLIIGTEDSHSVSEIKAPHITDEMYDAAWDLIYTLSTGKRRKPAPRFKKYREKREKERAALAAKKVKRKPKKNVIRDAAVQIGADAIRKELGRPSKASKLALVKGGAGNADPIGLHSMVEGNRSDEQT